MEEGWSHQLVDPQWQIDLVEVPGGVLRLRVGHRTMPNNDSLELLFHVVEPTTVLVIFVSLCHGILALSDDQKVVAVDATYSFYRQPLVFVESLLHGDFKVTSYEIDSEDKDAVCAIHNNAIETIEGVNLYYLSYGRLKAIFVFEFKAFVFVNFSVILEYFEHALALAIGLVQGVEGEKVDEIL